MGGQLRRWTPRDVGGAAARWAGDARGRTVVSYRRDGVVLGEHGMYVLGTDGTPVMCRSVTLIRLLRTWYSTRKYQAISARVHRSRYYRCILSRRILSRRRRIYNRSVYIYRSVL